MSIRILLSALFIFSFIFSPLANAQDFKRGIVGAGVGVSSINSPSTQVIAQAIPPGGSTIVTEQSKDDLGGMGWRAMGGFRFNQYFGVEGGFTKYADSFYKSVQSQYTGATFNGRNAAMVRIRAFAIDLALRATYSITDYFKAFVIAGGAYIRQDVDFTNPAGTPTLLVNTGVITTPKVGEARYHAYRPLIGLGVTVELPEHMGLNFAWRHIFGKGNPKAIKSAMYDLDYFGMTIIHRF